METFVCPSDGSLPRSVAGKYGRELTLKERLRLKIFGLGFFKPVPGGMDILSQWFQLKNNTIRPHLDQLTKGLIFRLTGTREINALAISYEEIARMVVRKEPDQVNPIPLSPFWFLIRLGVNPRKVRWLAMGRYGEFLFGDVEVTLEVQDQAPIRVSWSGRQERAVRKFFGSELLTSKVVIAFE